jgi:hypothetical protein
MSERRLYYVCEDPVHRAEIESWVAQLCGEVTDQPLRMSACLADLDFLPLGMQPADLLKELSYYPPCPKAVHGFNITPELREWLACHGIRTFRRMSPAAVARLLT